MILTLNHKVAKKNTLQQGHWESQWGQIRYEAAFTNWYTIAQLICSLISNLSVDAWYFLRYETMHIVNFPSRREPILCKHTCIGNINLLLYVNDQFALENIKFFYHILFSLDIWYIFFKYSFFQVPGLKIFRNPNFRVPNKQTKILGSDRLGNYLCII